MIIKDFVNDPDTHWCDAAKLYVSRFVPSTLDSVIELEQFILDDSEYLERILALHEEVNTPNQDQLVNRASRAVSTIQLMKHKEKVIERCGVLEPLDEYRLTRGSTLYSGTLYDVNRVSVVRYDPNEWWFAEGIDGTILKDEEEVESYRASVLLERKYYDSADDLSLWLAA